MKYELPECWTRVVIDGRKEDKAKTEMECKKADAIVLTYSCDRPQTLDRLSTYWLPELRLLEVSVLPWAVVKDKITTRAVKLCKWVPRLTVFDCRFTSQIKVPVIVVGCKLDLRDDRQPSLEQAMAPLMHEFREIETCIECSSMKQIQVLWTDCDLLWFIFLFQ